VLPIILSFSVVTQLHSVVVHQEASCSTFHR